MPSHEIFRIQDNTNRSRTANVFAFVCEDDFLVEESRPVWQRIFGGDWVFEKYPAKEFEEIPSDRLMDEALTPSLFTQNRVADHDQCRKITKGAYRGSDRARRRAERRR